MVHQRLQLHSHLFNCNLKEGPKVAFYSKDYPWLSRIMTLESMSYWQLNWPWKSIANGWREQFTCSPYLLIRTFWEVWKWHRIFEKKCLKPHHGHWALFFTRFHFAFSYKQVSRIKEQGSTPCPTCSPLIHRTKVTKHIPIHPFPLFHNLGVQQRNRELHTLNPLSLNTKFFPKSHLRITHILAPHETYHWPSWQSMHLQHA